MSPLPKAPGIATEGADFAGLVVTVRVAAGFGPRATLEDDTSLLPRPAMGGGYNSSLSAGVITLATPLNPGASVNMRFVFGVEGLGKFRVFVVVEALP